MPEVFPAQMPLAVSAPEPCTELNLTTQTTSAPKRTLWSVCDLLCWFWMMGPPMDPTLKKVFGQLDRALQNFARLHLMARGPEPDPAPGVWNWIWKGR